MYGRESIRERRQEWFVGSVEREVMSSGIVLNVVRAVLWGIIPLLTMMFTVRGLVAGKNVRILIDTGSAVTLVNEEILRDCAAVTHATAADKSVITANGEPLELVGTAEIPIIIQEEVIRYTVVVAKNIMQKCILGAHFLQALKCVVDLNNNTLHLNEKVIHCK